MKKIIYIVFTILILGGAITLLAFMRAGHQETICRELNIQISYLHPDTLIHEKEIRQMINQVCENIEGRPFAQIDLVKIRTALTSNPYIAECDLYALLNGSIRFRIKPRIPLFRINDQENSYYIDTQGYVMPVEYGKCARVLVASGNISDIGLLKIKKNILITGDKGQNVASGHLIHLFQMAQHISNETNLRALVDQIVVNDRREFEIFSKPGYHTILFGNAEDIGHKFDKLLAFYGQGITRSGWNAYSEIDLRYKDQVVCKKK